MNVFTKLLTNSKTYLVLVLILAFIVRLYKIDSPIADWHSWRQADTAAVARNFYQEGFNPLYPRGDDMSVISDNHQLNLERYRFVEFPIYNSLVYFAYLISGGVDEKLARLVSILFSLGSMVFIYLITKRYFDSLTAIIASLVFAILPFNIFFSRVILPEPSLVFFSLGMVYFVDRWIFENRLSLYILGLVFTICAFLTKPTAIFYTLPLLYSFWQREHKLFPIPWRYFLFVIPASLPFIGWRIWINQHPEGIPAASWLLNGNGIRFRPAFWKWIIGDRFTREILSGVGIALFLLGTLVKPTTKQGYFLHLLLLGSLAFLVVFATGNVQHDYYQTLIIPALAIFTGRGLAVLIQGVPSFLPRLWTIPMALVLFGLMLYLSWTEIKGLYQINNWAIVEAGLAADKLLPKEAIVVAPYGGDTAFLYQINRHGFPVIPSSLDELRDKYNVSYLVSVAKDKDTKDAMEKYQVLVDTPSYVIVDLTKTSSPSGSQRGR